MGFHLVRVGARYTDSTEPVVKVRTLHAFTFNRAAHELMNSPESVQVFLDLDDTDEPIVGIKAADGDADAYKIQPGSKRKDGSVNSYTVTCIPAFRKMGLFKENDVIRKIPSLSVEEGKDGMAVFSIPIPQEEPAPAPTPAKKAAKKATKKAAAAVSTPVS